MDDGYEAFSETGPVETVGRHRAMDGEQGITIGIGIRE